MDDMDILKAEVKTHIDLVRQLFEVKKREKCLKEQLLKVSEIDNDPAMVYVVALRLKGCEEQIEYLYKRLKEVNTHDSNRD